MDSKELFPTNYAVAVSWCNNNYVMCNNLPEIDDTIWENMVGLEECDEETDEATYPEIFQWFISDATQGDVNYLTEAFPGLIFTYSELLDCYILCVDHYGTNWKYIWWNTTNEMAKAVLGQSKQDL